MSYTDQDIVKNLSLSQSSSHGTSLVTIYVPGDSNLNLVTSQLTSELSTSQNIKSKTVRGNVQTALKSGLQKIKSYGQHRAPENGFVVCAGEIKSCV